MVLVLAEQGVGVNAFTPRNRVAFSPAPQTDRGDHLRVYQLGKFYVSRYFVSPAIFEADGIPFFDAFLPGCFHVHGDVISIWIERGYLVDLSPHLPPPYLAHERGTDQYGYVSFDGNYFWVPGTERDDVKVLEYSDRLKIYLNRKCLAEYLLPADDVKNQRFSPEGMPAPQHQPNNRKRPTQEEEKRLRAMSPAVDAYLDFALNSDAGIQRHRFIRELFALASRMTSSLFIQTIERALHYRIVNIVALGRIALMYMRQGARTLPCVDVDENFLKREAYLEGSLTDTPDFSIYDKMLEDDNG